MLKQFQQFIEEHKLFTQQNAILAAVSGGADSMVLLWLLLKGGYKVKAAHCNFNLRGAESDFDQKLVENFCQLNNVQLFVQSFDTFKESKKHGISIEMAARDLRYNWFNNLALQQSTEYIATGHHCNDNVETVFLNMTRGTVLRGLCGIKPVNENVVRPLLWALRSDIENFAIKNQIPFRTDSSNADISIPRNRIRHKVVPEVEVINPSFLKTMSENIGVWNQWFSFAQNLLSHQLEQHIIKTEYGFNYKFSGVEDLTTRRLILIEFLIQHGVNGSYAGNLARILDSQVGTTIETSYFKLVRDRNELKICLLDYAAQQQAISIIALPFSISEPIAIEIVQEDYNPTSGFSKAKNEIWIDASKVIWPLEIRTWRSGDFFKPFGMNGTKKVSDFLTDQKLSAVQKQKQTVLTDAQGLIWVIGERMDRRFAISKSTKEIIKIVVSQVR